MLQRIHIIGGPGSGKSYAARHLSHRLGVPAYDLDDLFWNRAAQSYGMRASEVDRDTRLVAITQEDAWVIEGVYYRWLKPSFERANIIFVLSPNVYLRDYRILKRFVSRKLGIMPTKKESLLDLCRLIQWNHKYDADNLKRAMDFFREFEHKVVACRSADDLLTRVIREAPNNTLERTAEKPAVAPLGVSCQQETLTVSDAGMSSWQARLRALARARHRGP